MTDGGHPTLLSDALNLWFVHDVTNVLVRSLIGNYSGVTEESRPLRYCCGRTTHYRHIIPTVANSEETRCTIASGVQELLLQNSSSLTMRTASSIFLSGLSHEFADEQLSCSCSVTWQNAIDRLCAHLTGSLLRLQALHGGLGCNISLLTLVGRLDG